MKIQETICQLQTIVAELTKTYHRPFTLDGHLIGSLGEVYAAEVYNLELLPPGTEKSDAITADGKLVQIKTTQRDKIGLYEEPDILLALKVKEDGTIEEVYYGEGHTPWKESGNVCKNGMRYVSLAKLRRIRQSE